MLIKAFHHNHHNLHLMFSFFFFASTALAMFATEAVASASQETNQLTNKQGQYNFQKNFLDGGSTQQHRSIVFVAVQAGSSRT